ncbi:hypothetical protein U14_01930 [Candidatus Moduliflexus flocculans]|uniref:Curli production assembly/transport component CsgG n=1 Tax=Candidatus Moduliflexus flocculans TaxID=1499966 RepID=A0A0S6VXW2_9BACT|nr:hypothetical protein U14_01930 [Candidatus Moduliflexus flocculans]
MKMNSNKNIVAVSIALVLSLLPSIGQAQGRKDFHLYVWDFGTRNGEKNELTDNFTVEFEDALIQANCYSVLERRNYDRLMSQKDNERAIMTVEGISDYSLQNLQVLEANAVIFGEVYDDVQSGEIKITALVQAFDGQKLTTKSVKLSRGKRLDMGSREESMQELARLLCSDLRDTNVPIITIAPGSQKIGQNLVINGDFSEHWSTGWTKELVTTQPMLYWGEP